MHESLYDDYVSAFVDHTRSLVVGDPLDAATDVGPMVSAAQRAKVVAQVEAAVAAGAELLTGGDSAGPERGHFYGPAVVTGAPAETDLLREETFGPVAPIVRVDRSTRRSSWRTRPASASARTSTPATSRPLVRCMREMKAGTVWINDPLTDNDAGPFGGFKQSGLGRELVPRGSRRSRRRSTSTWRRRSRRRSGGTPTADAGGLLGPGAPRGPSASSGERQGVLDATAVGPRRAPPRRSNSRSAKRQIARSSVSRSACRASGDRFFASHGGLIASTDLLPPACRASSCSTARWSRAGG